MAQIEPGSDSSDRSSSYPVGAGTGAVRGDSDVERERSPILTLNIIISHGDPLGEYVGYSLPLQVPCVWMLSSFPEFNKPRSWANSTSSLYIWLWRSLSWTNAMVFLTHLLITSFFNPLPLTLPIVIGGFSKIHSPAQEFDWLQTQGWISLQGALDHSILTSSILSIHPTWSIPLTFQCLVFLSVDHNPFEMATMSIHPHGPYNTQCRAWHIVHVYSFAWDRPPEPDSHIQIPSELLSFRKTIQHLCILVSSS